MSGTATHEGGRAFAFAALLAACSSSNPPPASCPGTVQQPLTNGSPQESYLGLAPAQIAAIVQIVSAGQPNGPLCSGIFVAPNWVITAGHCLQIKAAQTVVQGEGQSPTATAPVIASVAHPSEDVALLNVDVSASDAGGSDGGLMGVVPLEVGSVSSVHLAAGDVVEMAGYGLTEKGTVRSLRFLTESIRSANASTFTVGGFGASGACVGDSGGPLLVRAPNGSPVVAGVMSNGSATCLDDDTYVRLDSIQDWIQSTTGSYVATDRECGGIAAEGRCLYGSALWCSGTQLNADSCAGGKRCGWDGSQSGFRCVSPSADPCRGVDSVGACQAGGALRCNGGVLVSQACTSCDVCRTDGKTGRPVCTTGAAGE